MGAQRRLYPLWLATPGGQRTEGEGAEAGFRWGGTCWEPRAQPSEHEASTTLPPTTRSSARGVKATGSSLKGAPQFVGRAPGPRVPHTDWRPRSSSLNSGAEKHVADLLLHQRPGSQASRRSLRLSPRHWRWGGPEPSGLRRQLGGSIGSHPVLRSVWAWPMTHLALVSHTMGTARFRRK